MSHLCSPVNIANTYFSFYAAFSSYSLEHFSFIFHLSFHPTIILTSFHLSAFFSPLISAITALAQASALVISCPYSQLFLFLSCLILFLFFSLRLLNLSLSCHFHSTSDIYRWLQGQDVAFLTKLIENGGEWYSEASSLSACPSLITLHQSHADSISKCIAVLVLLCWSRSAPGVSLWFSFPL